MCLFEGVKVLLVLLKLWALSICQLRLITTVHLQLAVFAQFNWPRANSNSFLFNCWGNHNKLVSSVTISASSGSFQLLSLKEQTLNKDRYLLAGERWAWRCSVSVPSLPPCHHRFSLCITPPAAERCSSDQFSASVFVCKCCEGEALAARRSDWRRAGSGSGSVKGSTVTSHPSDLEPERWDWFERLTGAWEDCECVWVHHCKDKTVPHRRVLLFNFDYTLSPDENCHSQIILVNFSLHLSALVICRFIGFYSDTFSSFLASNLFLHTKWHALTCVRESTGNASHIFEGI